MKTNLLLVGLLLVSFTLTGCLAVMNPQETRAYYQTWEGHNLDDMTAAWGNPRRITTLDDGRIVATYAAFGGDTPDCSVKVVASKDKIIQSVKPTGMICDVEDDAHTYFPLPE